MRKDNRCLDYQKVIKESEAELRVLERGQSKALLRDRMRFLRLLKSGECTSQAAAGQRIGLKRRASEKLWRKYRQAGIRQLLDYPYKGYKGKLSEQQRSICWRRNSTPPASKVFSRAAGMWQRLCGYATPLQASGMCSSG